MTNEDRDDAIDKLIADIKIAYRVGNEKALHEAAKKLAKLTSPRPR